jgi:hypothetical protein
MSGTYGTYRQCPKCGNSYCEEIRSGKEYITTAITQCTRCGEIGCVKVRIKVGFFGGISYDFADLVCFHCRCDKYDRDEKNVRFLGFVSR